MKKNQRNFTPLPSSFDKLAMRESFPGFSHYFNRSEQMSVWRGKLWPIFEGNVYSVQITSNGISRPEARVTHPKIRVDAPHRFPDGSLCLYYPNDPPKRKWHPGRLVAATILPWTSEWLFWYEHWLETGEWYGSEAPHSPTQLV